jgi:hypothetical protein
MEHLGPLFLDAGAPSVCRLAVKVPNTRKRDQARAMAYVGICGAEAAGY